MASTELDNPGNFPLHSVDAWWRAANYLTVGQLYLQDNPMLRRPLDTDDIKRRPVGHWGTAPALNFIYAHLNRLIVRHHREILFIAGPGHGAAGVLANVWLDQTYSERFPQVGADGAGMRKLFRQFSFPGGVPSHAAPTTPGSIHEGGELGYSLVHAFGAALDNPQQIIACVVGDGEAETATLSASWQLNRVLNPVHDGTVLPILNLNGYKIANPTVLSRIPEADLLAMFRGFGYEPLLVEGGFDGENPMYVHQRMSAALELAITTIDELRAAAHTHGRLATPRWPMIILRTPKGWTGPRQHDGLPVENSWRSHQLPLTEVRANPETMLELEQWMRSYKPEELFARDGGPGRALAMNRPPRNLRMSTNPLADPDARPLVLPPTARAAADVGELLEPTRVLGRWLASVIRLNPTTFRVFGPDETSSNHLDPIWDVTNTQWLGEILPTDQHLANSGRVIELLSENLMQGLLEGYTLTGRHGIFDSYEAFIHVVDSMFNQHAKWLQSAAEVSWRRPVPSFTYLLSSHVWRQDHNGFSHQDPGFLNVVVNKGPDVVRVYLPVDANTLLVTAEHCLGTTDHVNVIIAGKQPSPVLLSIDEARAHGERGISVWDWAGSEVEGDEPDVVLVGAGDVPTLEVLAAARLLADGIPDLRVRVVNVVDLMRLLPSEKHPHGMTDVEFDAIFTREKPVVFAFHGYPGLIHELTYRRAMHAHLHVRGFQEKGTTTTPFDMLMLNDLDRYQLALDALRYVPGLEQRHEGFARELTDARWTHRDRARQDGTDADELSDWSWVRQEPAPRPNRLFPATTLVP